jgi:hypothetical protein
MRTFDDKKLNTIRGKNLVGKATKEDVFYVFETLDCLEQWLEEAECDDTFGTEGWRHAFEIYQRDNE